MKKTPAKVKRITKIEPWPKRVIEKAYRKMGKDWDEIEEAAIRARGKPSFDD